MRSETDHISSLQQLRTPSTSTSSSDVCIYESELHTNSASNEIVKIGNRRRRRDVIFRDIGFYHVATSRRQWNPTQQPAASRSHAEPHRSSRLTQLFNPPIQLLDLHIIVYYETNSNLVGDDHRRHQVERLWWERLETPPRHSLENPTDSDNCLLLLSSSKTPWDEVVECGVSVCKYVQ